MYDALAKHYDALTDADYYSRWYDYVDSLLAGRMKGMDIGCGSGAFTVELARRGKDIVGADVSESMLEVAFDKAVKAGVKPRFIRASAENFETPKPLDFVIAMNDGFVTVRVKADSKQLIRKRGHDSISYFTWYGGSISFVGIL